MMVNLQNNIGHGLMVIITEEWRVAGQEDKSQHPNRPEI